MCSRFFVHSDDVTLESAQLETWTGKNNPTKKKPALNIYSHQSSLLNLFAFQVWG